PAETLAKPFRQRPRPPRARRDRPNRRKPFPPVGPPPARAEGPLIANGEIHHKPPAPRARWGGSVLAAGVGAGGRCDVIRNFGSASEIPRLAAGVGAGGRGYSRADASAASRRSAASWCRAAPRWSSTSASRRRFSGDGFRRPCFHDQTVL